MGYIAKITITDLDSSEVYKLKGKAEATLLRGLDYIREKDGRGGMGKAMEFLKKDFAELDRQFQVLLYGKQKKS